MQPAACALEAEQLREQGNEAFRAGRYERSLQLYSQVCWWACVSPARATPLPLKVHAARYAAYVHYYHHCTTWIPPCPAPKCLVRVSSGWLPGCTTCGGLD